MLAEILDPTTAELVTWSKDHSLRIWKADADLLTACGCDELQDEDLLNDGQSNLCYSHYI